MNELQKVSRTDWKTWNPDIKATLMFIVQDGKVLLIEKLTGIGMGKINGPGGKIDPGENAEQAIIRECQEELHITPLNPVKVGELCFAMTHIPDIHCHVFIAEEFEGEPTATYEANPFWQAIGEIPFDKMWEDDRHWLPQALKGDVFHAKFDFVDEDITWMDVSFGAETKLQWLGDHYEDS